MAKIHNLKLAQLINEVNINTNYIINNKYENYVCYRIALKTTGDQQTDYIRCLVIYSKSNVSPRRLFSGRADANTSPLNCHDFSRKLLSSNSFIFCRNYQHATQSADNKHYINIGDRESN